MANVLPAGRGLGCSASSGAGHTVGLQQTLLALCRYEGHLTNLSVVCSGQGGHHPHFAGGKLSQRDEGTCPEHPEGDALGPGPHVGAQPSLCDVVLGSRLTWTLRPLRICPCSLTRPSLFRMNLTSSKTLRPPGVVQL